MKERDRGERIYVCVFECAREKLKLRERKKQIKRVHNSLLYSHCTQCVGGEGGRMGKSEYVCTATHCNMLQHTATHCNSLQHTATHCNSLQLSATHSHTLQHTATHYNTLQHTATYCNSLQLSATHCNTLQHTATHCNTLQRHEIVVPPT